MTLQLPLQGDGDGKATDRSCVHIIFAHDCMKKQSENIFGLGNVLVLLF